VPSYVRRLPSCQRRQPLTAKVFQRRNVCYDVPLHVWEIGLLLQQDTDCGTVSQQNCDNLTSPSDNFVAR